MGQNRENWDDCLKNVSAGVLTIFILYHVFQAQAFVNPYSMKNCFLRLGNSKPSRVRTPYTSTRPKEIIQFADQHNPIITIFLILAFYFIWLRGLLFLSIFLQLWEQQTFNSKSTTESLDSRTEKTSEAVRRPNPYWGVPITFHSIIRTLCAFLHWSKEADLYGQSHLWQQIATEQTRLNTTHLKRYRRFLTGHTCHGRNISENRLIFSK